MRYQAIRQRCIGCSLISFFELFGANGDSSEMRKLFKFLIVTSLIVLAISTCRYVVNVSRINAGASKIAAAVEMRYRRGSYERRATLDVPTRVRISKLLSDYKNFQFGFVKSVGYGEVAFFDAKGVELLTVDTFNGNVVVVGGTYVELDADFLNECGFSRDEWKSRRASNAHKETAQP